MKKNFSTGMVFIALALPLFGQTINELVCINAKVYDPVGPAKRFDMVRFYHDWGNDMPFSTTNVGRCLPTNDPAQWQYQWNPSYNQSQKFLNFDAFYAQFNGRAIPVLKGITYPYRGYQGYVPNWMEQKPTCPTPDAVFSNSANDRALLPTPIQQTVSNTFEGHALWASLFAAKFGGSKIQPATLGSYMAGQPLSPVAPKLIDWIEDNNETNKNWLEPAGVTAADFDAGNTLFYFSPKQYAAMFRADMDGNGSTMSVTNPNFLLGIRNTSFVNHIAMAGTTGLNGKYLLDASKDNALGKNFIANFHHYSNASTAAQSSAAAFFNGEFKNYKDILFQGPGVCPEDDRLRDKLKWLRFGDGAGNDGIDLDGAYQGYWLSEFGYDSQNAGNSQVWAPNQKAQAQWLTRGILETAWSKSIDKIMLYELRDDKTLGQNSYRYSGVLDDNGSYKISWFHLMTLKSVIGQYRYEYEIEDGKDGFTVSPSNVRVYQFSRGSSLKAKAFAIWSPTAEDIAPFDVEITFPDDPSNLILQQYPFDKVKLETPYFTEILDLSEKGKTTAGPSPNGSQTVTIHNVDETPQFLKFEGVVRPAPAHVTNLTCATGCCGSVTLSWTKPGLTINTLVYYRQKTEPGNCDAFDPNKCSLFANSIGVNRSGITVTGLELGVDYCFYAIPVNKYGLVPENLSAAPACSATTAAGPSTPFVNISATEISFDPGYPQGTIDNFLRPQLSKVLGIDQLSQPSCESLTWNCDNNFFQGYWDYWQDPNPGPPPLAEPNSVFIHFTVPKKLNTIYIQDWNGNGQVKIEYKTCDCNLWKTLSIVDLLGDFACLSPYPVPPLRILGNLPPRLITDLKITKLQSGFGVGHIFMCGETVVCPPPGGPIDPGPGGGGGTGDPGNGGGLLGEVDEVRTNSAVVRWAASTIGGFEDWTEVVDGYQLQLSQIKDANDQLLNPIIYDIETGPFDYELFYRLDGLAPGTTYFGKLFRAANGCGGSGSVGGPVFEFTTPIDGEATGRNAPQNQSKNAAAQSAFSIRMNPNPASDLAEISISVGGISSISIMDELGRTLRTQPGGGAKSLSLNLSGIKTGKYWLRVTNEEGIRQTFFFLKQ